MKPYIDGNGNELKKGFYNSPLWYFTGDYNKKGRPIFEDGYGRILGFDRDMAMSMIKLTNEDMKKIIEEEKQNLKWLEEKAKE